MPTTHRPQALRDPYITAEPPCVHPSLALPISSPLSFRYGARLSTSPSQQGPHVFLMHEG